MDEIVIVLSPLHNSYIVPAQGDTGANVSATNDILIIHNYFEYYSPSKGIVFLDEPKTDVVSLVAVGQGIIKIISDQGSVMNWSVLYTPSSTGTVLSPDHYHHSNISRYYSSYHSGSSNRNCKIGFLDNNKKEVESI